MSNYRFRYQDQKRYDQTEKPFYPLFDMENTKDKLDRVGWRSNCKSLKYKTAHPQGELSMNRGHLKFFDRVKPSNFNGKPAGFNEPCSDQPIVDMHP